VGRLLKAGGIADRYLRGGEELPPLVRGVGLTPLPRPEKMYFVVGKAIDTQRYRGHHEDPATLRRVRDRVARQLRALMAEARERRASDRDAGALRALINRF